MQNSSSVMDSLYILGLVPGLSRQCLLLTHLSTPPPHVIVGGNLLHLSFRIPAANLHFTIIAPSLQTMLHLVNNCLNVVTTDISLPSHAGPFLPLAANIDTQSHPVCRLPLSSVPEGVELPPACTPVSNSPSQKPLPSLDPWCLISTQRIGSCPSSKRGNSETLKANNI